MFTNLPEIGMYICIQINNNTLKEMISLKKFTFNPFSENTYVIWDETKEAVIIDPGMVDGREEQELVDFIDSKGLTPVKLFLTHAHIDHVLGCYFVKKQWDLVFLAHPLCDTVLQMSERAAEMYGVPYTPSPLPDQAINEGEMLTFGKSEMELLFVPGHAPDHLALVDRDGNKTIAGDVLFDGSVGRVDLPGSDAKALSDSIQQKMYALPDEMVVYSGHGGETTIGKEKKTNPFVREGWSGFLQGE